MHIRLPLAGIIVGLAAATVVMSGSLRASARQPPSKAHDERIAGNVAEKFSWALTLTPALAYGLLDERARARMPPADFLSALSRMFPSGNAVRLEARQFAPADPLIDIFLTGRE